MAVWPNQDGQDERVQQLVGKQIKKAWFESRYVLILEFTDGSKATLDLDDPMVHIEN